jgi:hypothetical protein
MSLVALANLDDPENATAAYEQVNLILFFKYFFHGDFTPAISLLLLLLIQAFKNSNSAL